MGPNVFFLFAVTKAWCEADAFSAARRHSCASVFSSPAKQFRHVPKLTIGCFIQLSIHSNLLFFSNDWLIIFHVAESFTKSTKFPLNVFLFFFPPPFLLFIVFSSYYWLFFKPIFYAFKFYHLSKGKTEPALLFRVYARWLDHRITVRLAHSLSLTVNLDDRSAGRRSCWVWVKQPWPPFCWIRLMLQTGYHDPFPAVACHAGCAPLSRTAVKAKSIKTFAVGDSFYTSNAPFLHISEPLAGDECVITIFFFKPKYTTAVFWEVFVPLSLKKMKTNLFEKEEMLLLPL